MKKFRNLPLVSLMLFGVILLCNYSIAQTKTSGDKPVIKNTNNSEKEKLETKPDENKNDANDINGNQTKVMKATKFIMEPQPVNSLKEKEKIKTEKKYDAHFAEEVPPTDKSTIEKPEPIRLNKECGVTAVKPEPRAVVHRIPASSKNEPLKKYNEVPTPVKVDNK